MNTVFPKAARKGVLLVRKQPSMWYEVAKRNDESPIQPRFNPSPILINTTTPGSALPPAKSHPRPQRIPEVVQGGENE